jgi:glyceraldehyde 3-phosphate dehydrogenase
MLKIGLNGFGRIGRAIFKNALLFDDVKIVAINDINPEIENLKYLLKYDSFYGRLDKKVEILDDHYISVGSNKVKMHQEKHIKNVQWNKLGCDIVIEAAGIHSLLDELPSLIESGVKKVIVTYSPQSKVDNYFVLGANEKSYDANLHNIVSSSICDSVAFSPVYKILNDAFGVKSGFLTTMHPWLAYQNLLDGPAQSWGYPGSLYGHYSLGRAATSSLILKPTTAIAAANNIIPGLVDKMKCYSYRVPTPVVGAADITFQTSKTCGREEILELFQEFIKHQKWPILYLNEDPLVSVDFTGTDYSAIVDKRWLEVIDGSMVKITLWYDNEYGYSRRVVDLARFLFNMKPMMNQYGKNSLS